LRADGSEFPIELTIKVMRLAPTRISLDTLRDPRSEQAEEEGRLLAADRRRARSGCVERRSPFSQKPAPSSRLPSAATLEQVGDWPCPSGDYALSTCRDVQRMRLVATGMLTLENNLVERSEFPPTRLDEAGGGR